MSAIWGIVSRGLPLEEEKILGMKKTMEEYRLDKTADRTPYTLPAGISSSRRNLFLMFPLSMTLNGKLPLPGMSFYITGRRFMKDFPAAVDFPPCLVRTPFPTAGMPFWHTGHFCFWGIPL